MRLCTCKIVHKHKKAFFNRKSEIQMFLLIFGRYIGVACWYTSTASPYKAQEKTAWNFLENN